MIAAVILVIVVFAIIVNVIREDQKKRKEFSMATSSAHTLDFEDSAANSSQPEATSSVEETSVAPIQAEVVKPPVFYNQTNANAMAADIVPLILKEMNCKYQQFGEPSDSTVDFFFLFQAGRFSIMTLKSSMSCRLQYKWFVSVGQDYKDLLRELCEKYTIISPEYKYVMEYDAEENKFDGHIFYDMRLTGDVDYDTKQMNYAAERCFARQREFLNELQQEKDNFEQNSREKRETYDRLLQLGSLSEMKRIDVTDEEQTEEVSSRNLLQLLGMLHEAWLINDPTRMDIITKKLQVYDDLDTIQRQDILQPLYDEETNTYTGASVTYQLTYPADRVIVTVDSSIEDRQQLLFKVTVCSTQSNLQFRFVLVYNKLSKEQRKAEATYMLQESSENDQAVAKEPWAEAFYWGRKHFMNDQFMDAIGQLEIVFKMMNNRSWRLTHPQHLTFIDVASMLGTSYKQLKLYKQALYYLNLVTEVAVDLPSYIEYINLLVEQNDFRAAKFIDAEARKMNDYYKEHINESISERTEEYWAFLRRARIQTHINDHNWKEARELLKPLLDDEETSEYAQKQLNIIQQKELEDTVLEHKKR